MRALARRLKFQIRRATGRSRPPIEVDVATEEDLLTATFWIESRDVVLNMPPELLAMQGAFRFDLSHPFVRALDKGVGALAEFYAAVRPADLAEYYRLPKSGRAGETLPAWELPWYGRLRREPPPGEAGLPREDGYSFYGPVTERKLRTEMERLDTVRASIGKHGFQPALYGYPEGYVLKCGNRCCFFVRGGKHRVAAMSQLGARTIPVRLRATFPRLVDAAHARYFPLVRSADVDIDLATAIIERYVHPPGTSPL